MVTNSNRDAVRSAFAIANREYSENQEAAVCFAFTVFYDGTVLENADGIRHFYETALPLIRDRLTCFDVDGRMKYKKIGPKAFSALDQWLRAADARRDNYGLILESGPTVGDCSDGGLHFYHSGTLYPGFLRLTLPIESALENPRAMMELGLALTNRLRILAGYGGFCLATYLYSGWEAGGPLYVLSRRFRGVDFVDPYRFREYHQFGIAAANWLTWVGSRWLPKVGGPEALATKATAPLVLHAMPGGAVMLQAGPHPLWGDTNRDESLDAYRAAGRVLSPVRFPSDTIGRDGSIGGGENTREWLECFDKS